MNGLFKRIVICMTLLIGWPCMLAAKPWPQPPYTEESIEAFADSDDLESLYSLINFKSKNDINNRMLPSFGFFKSLSPFEYKVGMVTLSESGMTIERVEAGSRNSLVEDLASMKALPAVTWDANGKIVGIRLDDMDQSDIESINNLDSLMALDIFNGLIGGGFNAAEFSDSLPLKAIHFISISVTDMSEFCRYDSLEYVQVSKARIRGNGDFSGCPESLRNLIFGSSDIESAHVGDLPNLEALYFGGSTIKNLTIDGPTLKSLKSLTLSESDIAPDVSKVRLPDGLVQLYLRKATDRDLSRLELPQNLQYVDLRDAQLGDYTFLEKAKNLTALNLWGSDFDQWSMLSQFTKLEHLNLNVTSLATEDLQYLSSLTQLKTLSLGGTKVTSLEALSELQNLWYLNVYRSELRDLDRVPTFHHVSELFLPLEEYHRNPSQLPAHIQRMLQSSGDSGECGSGQICPEPPWAE